MDIFQFVALLTYQAFMTPMASELHAHNPDKNPQVDNHLVICVWMDTPNIYEKVAS